MIMMIMMIMIIIIIIIIIIKIIMSYFHASLQHLKENAIRDFWETIYISNIFLISPFIYKLGHYAETSQSLNNINQLTGFCMKAASTWIISYVKRNYAFHFKKLTHVCYGSCLKSCLKVTLFESPSSGWKFLWNCLYQYVSMFGCQ